MRMGAMHDECKNMGRSSAACEHSAAFGVALVYYGICTNKAFSIYISASMFKLIFVCLKFWHFEGH